MDRARPPTSRSGLRRLLQGMRRTLAGVLVGLGLVLPAQAAPDAATSGREADAAADGADPILTLLGERGLLKQPPQALVQTVRDTVRESASELVLVAMNFLGVPYRRGGRSADTGFDCSGFTRHIFEHSIGLVLPRRADEQATTAGLLPIARTELRPGDLVFFNTMRRAFSHVGIYVGDNKFIHAPKPGDEVRIDDMRTAYWNTRFTGARRADMAAAALRPARSP